MIPWSTLAALAPRPTAAVTAPRAEATWHPMIALAAAPRSIVLERETPRLATARPGRVGPAVSPQGDVVWRLAPQLFVSPWAGRAKALDPTTFPLAGSRTGPLSPEATIKVGWVIE